MSSIIEMTQSTTQTMFDKSCKVTNNTKNYLKRFCLATLGATAICQEKAIMQIEKFENRGSLAEKQITTWFQETVGKNYNDLKQKTINKGSFFEKINISSKKDVSTLVDKAEVLNERINKMSNTEEVYNEIQAEKVLDHTEEKNEDIVTSICS